MQNVFRNFHITLICCKHIRDALRDLVPYVEFKKHGKHPWRSVTLGKVIGHGGVLLLGKLLLVIKLLRDRLQN